MFYAISVMLTDSGAGSEFSTTTLSLAYGGFTLVGGGLAFVIGRRADRLGVRSMTIAGFMLGAVGLVAFGRATAPSPSTSRPLSPSTSGLRLDIGPGPWPCSP